MIVREFLKWVVVPLMPETTIPKWLSAPDFLIGDGALLCVSLFLCVSWCFIHYSSL
jgi:hypothetical protein